MNNKRFFSFYRVVCGISLFCLLFPSVAAVAASRHIPVVSDAAAGLLASCAVLLVLPVSEERAGPSFWYAVAMAAVCAAGSLSGWPVRNWVSMLMLVQLLYLVHRGVRRYVQLRPLFRHLAVWYNLENQARHLYSLALFLLTMFFPSASSPAWTTWLLTTAAAVLYVLLQIRVRTGRTLFVKRVKELEIKELIRGNLRTAPAQAGEQTEDVARMSRLYARVVAYMEQKQPYLDEEFGLEDLSVAVFTNKSYLSKTVNVMSGRNFSQFVNYYRIQYCLELMRKDPHLKVVDLALMSGFHTTVTFTMAFKLNVGETPSQYLERVRTEYRK